MVDEQQPTPPGRPAPSAGADADWERDLLARLAYAGLEEQRRNRRWGILFKSLGFLYLFALLVLFVVDLGPSKHAGPHTALVDVTGVIADGTEASADNVVSGLRAAFEDHNTAGVVLRINSPGGSPVQAGYINDEIKRLREKYPDTPLYAVISDICASGGYYVAAAADRIYADKASIVGSIGVRMDSFGFVEAIDKLGVERRLLTAGEHKALMDPFLPVDPGEKQHLEGMLSDIHGQFVDVVKSGRGERLIDDPRIFSGLVWTGAKAIDLGLVDELGSAGYVAREVIGEDKIVDYTPRQGVLERLSRNVGASFGQAVAEVFTGPVLR